MDEYRMSKTRNILMTCALPLALAGCAAGDHAEDFYVAPGKYVLYDCKQLAGAAAHFEARAKELSGLRARAKQDAGGELVSALAYDADYYSTLGELKDIHREQAQKTCSPDITAPPTPPPTGKPTGRR
jgi:hypothetical protein